MHTSIISHNTPFSMLVVFNKGTTQFELQFISQSRYSNRAETVSSPYYREIADKFVKNCRYYGVPVPYIPTEEEFLGLAPRTLYPSAGKNQAAGKNKEVVNA